MSLFKKKQPKPVRTVEAISQEYATCAQALGHKHYQCQVLSSECEDLQKTMLKLNHEAHKLKQEEAKNQAKEAPKPEEGPSV